MKVIVHIHSFMHNGALLGNFKLLSIFMSSLLESIFELISAMLLNRACQNWESFEYNSDILTI